jgi:hypothetical protein
LGIALCLVAYIQGNRAYGHAAVRYYAISNGVLDDYMISLQWGNGGLSLQRRVDRFANAVMASERSQEPNPTFQRLRSGSLLYRFGGGPDTQSVPHHFPLTWGFQFSFHHEAYGFTDPKTAPLIWAITMPIWFLLVIFSIIPTFWTIRTYRRWRRPKAGCCAGCGYDLRASTDKCPECGRPIPARPETKAPDTGDATPSANNT